MTSHSIGPVEHRPPPVRLGPADITAGSFDRVRRNGLNADQVHAFLRLVADEMAALHRDVAAKTDENQRLKTALVAWQAQVSPTNTPDGYLSRTGRSAVPRPLRDTDYPTHDWPTIQPPHHAPDPGQL